MAHISLKNIHVDGVNSAARSMGLKQLLITGKRVGGKGIRIPIICGIDLEVSNGEKLGIVGYNGSGKSSLLKVIAGIYPPQKGNVTISGHVVPMIEMGLGFEPEMTGRENIRVGLLYNSRYSTYSPQIEKEVIEVSGLGDKIDQPFKSFSSGMRARLAFAVGVFNNPDILLLDEIFAPGDESFIKTSKQIMTKRFLSSSISILVSHNAGLIKELCTRCIWVDKGVIRMDGKPDEVVKAYQQARV